MPDSPNPGSLFSAADCSGGETTRCYIVTFPRPTLRISAATFACGTSAPTTASNAVSNAAVVAIGGLAATVEPITSHGNGWLSRLTYHVHETSGHDYAVNAWYSPNPKPGYMRKITGAWRILP